MNISLSGKYGTGKYAIIDDDDYFKVSKHSWCINSSGYITGNIGKGITKSLHSFILNTKFEIDHINGNKLDCRKSNLRICTRSQNNMNKRKSKYKFKGVFPSRTGRWRAQITFQRKTYCLGTFNNDSDAAIAYDTAAIYLFKEFSKTNFPRENYEHI